MGPASRARQLGISAPFCEDLRRRMHADAAFQWLGTVDD